MDLKALCDTLVVGRCECAVATGAGILESPPDLNLNGREARLEICRTEDWVGVNEEMDQVLLLICWYLCSKVPLMRGK